MSSSMGLFSWANNGLACDACMTPCMVPARLRDALHQRVYHASMHDAQIKRHSVCMMRARVHDVHKPSEKGLLMTTPDQQSPG